MGRVKRQEHGDGPQAVQYSFQDLGFTHHPAGGTYPLMKQPKRTIPLS